jgi:cytochrome c biogenesis protein CcmG/thiol:disulfide interchange protein DsbE
MKPIRSSVTFLGKPQSNAKRFRMAVVALTVAASVCTLQVTRIEAKDHAAHPAKAATDLLLPEDQRKIAPGFSLTNADGKSLNLADYRGKVVLLDFWATWCGGCKLEIPWYMEFDKKYKGHGLAVIGVSMDEDGWKAVRPFLARQRDPETGGKTAMKYPVVIGNETLVKEYNMTSMPMTLLIDRKGRIALSHTGMVNKADFEGHILELLR